MVHGSSHNRSGAHRDDAGAGTIEYTAMVVGVVVLVGVVAALFPPVGQRVTCALSTAFTTLSGGEAASCAASGENAGPGSRWSVSVAADPTATAAPARLQVDVDDGVTYTVTSDQPWAVPYGDDWGKGSGDVPVLFQSNAGDERQATLTITSSDGKTEKVTVTQPGQTQTYVAWGDSYSAGVGANPDVTPWGADYDTSERRKQTWGFGWPRPDAYNEDKCYRANDGWPRQLGEGRQSAAAGTPNLAMGKHDFRACSGATWDGTNLKGGGGSPSVKDQMDAGGSSAGVVTFTVGGNDIGFGDIVTNCILPFGDCADKIAEGRRLIADDLGPRLTDAYEHALESAPNATVYVVGYPPVVEMDDMGNLWKPGQIMPGNIPEAVQLLTDLNDKMRETVDEVNKNSASGPRLVYVDPAAKDSPFNGHSVGDADPYTNGVTLHLVGNPKDIAIPSYHPNKKGNDAYAQIVARYIMGDYGG